MNATATITITETNGTIKAEVQYDPLPVTGGIISEAAKIANWMVSQLQKQLPEDDVLYKRIYDARTGETFTKDNMENISKAATDYQSTV